MLKIVKFTPPIFIITIAIIITFFLYLEKQITLNKEKYLIKNEFIKINKEKVANDVEEFYAFILKTQEQTENKLKNNIKTRVYEANNIAMRIYEENKNSKTKDEIKKLIKDALVDIRFNNGRGYFFIYGFDYECILLPINRKLEGTNFYNFKDGEGEYLTRNIIAQLKKEKEGFLSWSFHKPDDMKKQYKKIGFNIYFEPYDWFIGTGEYVVDFEKDVKKEVLEYVSRIAPNDKNYFFILDYEKNTLFHIIKELIDKPAKEVTNIKEPRIFDDMVFIAKSGEAFITYTHKPLNSDSFLTKTSYIKGLNNWEWIIGKGFYQDDMKELIEKKSAELNNEFKKRIINIISVALILTFILLLLSIYISKILETKFSKYKKEIQKYMDESTKQQHILAQQSKMAAMGEMLGNIAHQWRQPLSVITTAATGMKLQKEFETLDDETFERSIENINNSAIYLSKTIDDFRNFFKTDKTETSFELEETFEKVFKLLKGQFKNNEIVFIKDIQKINAFGLENELIQALINILNNSKDALVEKELPRLIFINVYEENSKAIIKIKDNAGGIDERILDKVCEPYFTTKHQSKGTGIGLYMTEEIIVKHMNANFTINNCEFEYEKKSYKGAEITIEINL
ncbi:MAG: cache domain-containing protein [Aliarcobacter sp.]|nr:cache domain-containing protein [Aliarcobacter sp.]